MKISVFTEIFVFVGVALLALPRSSFGRKGGHGGGGHFGGFHGGRLPSASRPLHRPPTQELQAVAQGHKTKANRI
jgi:hypothetical protein